MLRRLLPPPQILILVLLTLAIVGSYRIARHFLTPASFGQLGWYRSEALHEIAARRPVYAGKQACGECHSEILQKLGKFEHKGLSCESCHGASKAHTDDPDVAVTKPDANRCLRCHEANPSRPAWMPQIVSAEHFKETDSTKANSCTSCHSPHQPNEMPDETPAKGK